MSNWRARRYVANINRRHRVSITVRRFRLAAKQQKKSNRTQLVINVRLGRIRQLAVEYRHLRRPGRRAQRQPSWRFQTGVASALVVIGLGGMTYSVSALARPKSLEPAKTFTTVAAAQTPVQAPTVLPAANPTHIAIPSQQIDTDLTPVGLNADGSIELPPVLDWVAGWYKYSPTPGERGPAVIVGHVDSYENISVFWRLRYVRAGDTIDVSREDGTMAHFQVTQLSQYDQHTFPTDTVYGNTSDAELRLITCGGSFDSTTGHYTENTVVYAKLVS